MKRAVRLVALLLIFCLLPLAGCSEKEEDGRISVVCTIFPQYDFVRELAGDDVRLTMLLPPGVESHSYDPTPADMLSILECDLFIYTGSEMEPWAASILDGIGDSVEVLDLSGSVELMCSDHDHEGHEHEHHEHEHEYDPHIWTSPANASLMAQAIAQRLTALMPDDSAAIADELARYQAQLSELDAQFAQLFDESEHKTLVFAGRFAMGYFTERYGLEHIAAFDSCSHEAEPSIGEIKRIIDVIERGEINAIFYEELVDPAVARIVAEQTGAKPLLLHTCHNLSADEMRAGETYLSLMRANLENLKEALL